MQFSEEKLIVDREHVKNTFATYTDKYDSSDEKIRLKIEHTYRVAELCDRIADDLGLVGEDKEIAWLLGMLHDVGRFEQVKRYGTFNDANSVDHAQFGADLLFKENLIKEYIPSIVDGPKKELIELAIRQHNVYRLPENLTEKEQLFCKIIRDADKVDIFKVNIDVPMEEIYDVTTEEIKAGLVSEEVMQAFKEKHCVLKSIRKTAVDHLVGHISLAYELEFPVSLKIAVEQGYLIKMMDFKSNNKKTNEQFAFIKNYMLDYIAQENHM